MAATKIMSKTTCAATTVRSPSVTPTSVKKDNNPIARTISGTTAGRNTAESSTRLLTVRSSPRASKVPSTTEIAVTTMATNTVFFSASNRSSG